MSSNIEQTKSTPIQETSLVAIKNLSQLEFQIRNHNLKLMNEALGRVTEIHNKRPIERQPETRIAIDSIKKIIDQLNSNETSVNQQDMSYWCKIGLRERKIPKLPLAKIADKTLSLDSFSNSSLLRASIDPEKYVAFSLFKYGEKLMSKMDTFQTEGMSAYEIGLLKAWVNNFLRSSGYEQPLIHYLNFREREVWNKYS